VNDVRIGKHISLQVEAHDKTEAENMTREACEKLLANPVMEAFNFTLAEG
jgi:phosphoribosylformylglycinamidine synthase